MLRLLCALLPILLAASLAGAEPLHGISMHGTPALAPDFKHFPYVNPDVKKGGRISYGVVGSFNNLNPFIIKGKRTTARGMWDPEFGNFVVEPLMMRAKDEPFTMYGLLAETVEWDDARNFIQFNLNPKAKWSDGKPVTPEDVIFTFELMRDHGAPPFSTRLIASKIALVEKMEKVGDRSVRFTLAKDASRELPLLLALSPVLPKHATKIEGFEQTTLTPLLGSGPYLVKQVKPGEKIVYKRDPNYWARNLPSKVGIDNYDEVSVEYFLQDSSLFEAFKKGEVDLYQEGSPTKWKRSYDFPAVTSGAVVKDSFKPRLPANMFAMVFNTRRPLFADPRIREGLTLAFDFEWVNKSLFENAYVRTQSFWQNSVLSSLDVPASPLELQLLGEAKDRLSAEVLSGKYRLPVTDASGRDRKVLRQAFDLFKSAGYKISGGRMLGPDGRPLAFEILAQNQDQEKIVLAYQRNLAALGIAVTIRTVEDAQYQERTQTFDYDMILKTYSASLSPGIEQMTRWGTLSRDRPGSDNFAGVSNPDIDNMIQHILSAKSEDEFEAAVRAHDRLLVSGHYLVPLYHIGEQWVARRKHIGHPEYLPLYGAYLPSWWDERAQQDQ
ncbi:extracellular solute-binding protein [Rhizobium sp. TH2]|uniref:extracellular solute-binding protein n=1 Tax=Rhizobium sp. TH2 TaxID=2775403 RepID=UPI002157E653|nr:extracellular solute-binding protein [Rhizobium sp. TH2]